jgi:dolichol-phosphate mannosyltransferase
MQAEVGGAMDLSIVIPCYNEVESLPSLWRDLSPALDGLARSRTVELVLVDDGSADGTYDSLAHMAATCPIGGVQIQVLWHPRNRGLGAALRTGLRSARGDVVVTTDCDGTYRFAEIPALLRSLTAGVDIVVASPYHPQGGVAGVPPVRLLLSKGSSALYRLLVSPAVHTYTSLFRACRRAVVQDVAFESDGFLGGTELLVRAILQGRRVAEYPTVLNVRAHGASKARLLRTILAHVRFLGRVALHPLRVQPLSLGAPTGDQP